MRIIYRGEAAVKYVEFWMWFWLFSSIVSVIVGVALLAGKEPVGFCFPASTLFLYWLARGRYKTMRKNQDAYYQNMPAIHVQQMRSGEFANTYQDNKDAVLRQQELDNHQKLGWPFWLAMFAVFGIVLMLVLIVILVP